MYEFIGDIRATGFSVFNLCTVGVVPLLEISFFEGSFFSFVPERSVPFRDIPFFISSVLLDNLCALFGVRVC